MFLPKAGYWQPTQNPSRSMRSGSGLLQVRLLSCPDITTITVLRNTPHLTKLTDKIYNNGI